MTQRLLPIIWGLLLAGLSFSQAQYPFPIPGGAKVRLDVPNTQDTLWVLTHLQYKKALEIAKQQEIDLLKIRLLEQKTNLYKEMLAEKDSLVALYNKGYMHYLTVWEETNIQLEKAEIKASKNWRYLQSGFIVGTLVTAGITAYLMNLKN